MACARRSGVASANPARQSLHELPPRVGYGPPVQRRGIEKSTEPLAVRKPWQVAVQRIVDARQLAREEAPAHEPCRCQVAIEERMHACEQRRPHRRLGIARPEAPHSCLFEDVVAGEELIRSLTGEDDLVAALLDRPREGEHRRRRRPKQGLLGKLHSTAEPVRHRGTIHVELTQVNAESVGDRPLRVGLVDRRPRKRQAERLEPAGVPAGCQRDDD